MLARSSLSRATTQCLRTAPRYSRTIAAAAGPNPFQFEVSDAQGIKIASRDDGAPTTSLALVVRGGSRYEAAPGLAHALQQFTWKNTDKRSALRVQRESELLGGKIGSSVSRENVVLKAQFLRQDLPYFVEAMADVLTSTRFQHYVFSEEVAPTMQFDLKKLIASPSRLALEHAFGAAFHRGLGASLLATSNKYVNPGSIAQYASQVYNKSNIALVASGAPHAELNKWTIEFFGDLKTGSKASSPSTKYFGGEARVSSAAGSSYIIAFPGTPSPNFKAEYKVLTHLLGGETAVKWNAGFSLLSRAVAGFPGVSAVAKQQHFTDAGLLYITVEGPDALLEKAGQAVVKAINDVTKVSEEEVKKAIAQAKFDVLSEVEDRSVGLELVGQSLIQNGTAPQANVVVRAIEAVTADSVKKAASNILRGKATYAAVGDCHVLPFAEDLGLKI
ncbi:LuxS/MPP-like metallohydrolase [Terfezia boudieri ATCC MYA-4762]|uniref:Cytochrome b-c1 complex subunit 2, mitochondrial n=1 Tax=Terfezia boudieri ATCC MYA-4762 TaxID=1051890 RepID=A0A3N4LX97_9PEZI|nr:LuxS/MPP-like metallohydrolase [Terfezia boudieri ATCC MYA-4762]